MPGMGDSGSLGNGMERLLLGVELGGEDAEEDVERESDGVQVRARGRRKATLRYLSMGEGCGDILYRPTNQRDSPVARNAEKQNSHTTGRSSSSAWVLVAAALVIKESWHD